MDRSLEIMEVSLTERWQHLDEDTKQDDRLEMGKNPNPARTNRTKTRVLSRTEPETEPESKKKMRKNADRTEIHVPRKELNRTRTQMSWFLLGSFAE